VVLARILLRRGGDVRLAFRACCDRNQRGLRSLAAAPRRAFRDLLAERARVVVLLRARTAYRALSVSRDGPIGGARQARHAGDLPADAHIRIESDDAAAAIAGRARLVELEAVGHARIEEDLDRRKRNDQPLGNAVEGELHLEAG